MQLAPLTMEIREIYIYISYCPGMTTTAGITKTLTSFHPPKMQGVGAVFRCPQLIWSEHDHQTWRHGGHL